MIRPSPKPRPDVIAIPAPPRATLAGHVAIARIDHWFKNVFVLPGVVAALGMDPGAQLGGLPWRLVLGLAAICLVASSNYVINELMDAPFDREHPTKRLRPVPSGLVNVPLAYVEWLVLVAVGVGLGVMVSTPFALTLVALWVMGCVYNLPPVRSKDVPYIDVLSEAVNNPLRMLAGWYIVSALVPPASLLLSYWMIGSYFMAMKRFAEYREIANRAVAAAYRRSFRYYDSRRLLVSIMFYGSAAMLFFGAFIMRYRLELVMTFPLVSWIMAIYLSLSFKPNSAVQQPEKLYREPVLMAAVVGCTLMMAVLLFVDVPALYRVFAPTVPATAGWLHLRLTP
jgi:4-hydroxybenzoate polyprenyltransferase